MLECVSTCGIFIQNNFMRQTKGLNSKIQSHKLNHWFVLMSMPNMIKNSTEAQCKDLYCRLQLTDTTSWTCYNH